MAEERVIAVEMKGKDLDIVEALIRFHHSLGNIPQPTASQYLKYLIFEDANRMLGEIEEHRSQLIR